MAGVLRFSDYLGGPDSISVEEIFPSTKRTYQYDFNQNISGWTWSLKAQSIVVNPLSWDRYTGEPNFANSQVVGYFPNATLATDTTTVNVVDAATGRVNLTVPGNLYTGQLIPDARSKVVITIVTFGWTTAETPAQVNSHRWAFIQCYEPGVAIGDPTLSTNPLYTAFTVAA